MKLWTQQKNLVLSILSNLKRYNRILVEAPTGFGKRVIFCHLAKKWSEDNKKVLILVHTNELKDQITNHLKSIKVPYGLIASDTRETKELVQVVMVRTLKNRIKKGISYLADYVIVDEAHHSVASTWKYVLDHFDSRVIGFTATPFRYDGSGLDACYQKLISRVNVADLIKENKLSKFAIYASENESPNLKDVKVIGGDYSLKELEKKINKQHITGDAIDHYKKHCNGKSAIVFCVSINHAKDVAKEFNQKGVKTESIHSRLSTHDRIKIIKNYSDNKIKVLTTVDILCEGFDVPHTESVIQLRPTVSLTKYLQIIGRGMRFHHSKKELIILDTVGNVFRFGFPDEKRKHSLKGLEKQELKYRNCNKCHHVFSSTLRKCPKCGFKVIEHIIRGAQPRRILLVPGYLKRISWHEAVERNKKRRQRLMLCRSLQDYTQFAKDYGFKEPEKWAKYIFHRNKNKKLSDSDKRYCGPCGKIKPISEFNNGTHRCRVCQTEYRKNHYEKNKHVEKEYTKKWRTKNPERYKENKKRWEQENLEKYQRQKLEAQARWRLKRDMKRKAMK